MSSQESQQQLLRLSKPSRRYSHLRFLVVLAAAVLCVALPLPVHAVRPQPQDCQDPDANERMKCKFQNVMAQQAHMVGTITTTPAYAQQLTPNQVTRLENAKARAEQKQNRLLAEDFRAITRKRNDKCPFRQWQGDDDPICRGNEQCLEVIGDGIGDDVQPCITTGPKIQREECVQLCDPDEVENIDADFADELEQTYDDMTAQLEETNDLLEQTSSQIAQMSVSASSNDPCAVTYTRTDTMAYISLKLVAVTTRGLADVAERGCDQVAMGFSGGAACAALEVVAMLAAEAFNVVDTVESIGDSRGIDATMNCITQVRELTSQNQQAIQELQAGLDEVIRLLNTPLGQRPNFPDK